MARPFVALIKKHRKGLLGNFKNTEAGFVGRKLDSLFNDKRL